MSEASQSSRPITAADDVRPVVPLPPTGPSLGVIVAGCAVLGFGLFLFLDGRRTHPPRVPVEPAGYAASQLPTSPPPLSLPAPLPPLPPPPPAPPVIKYVDRQGPPPPPIIRYIERPAPMAPAPLPQPIMARSSPSPALVIDLSEVDDPGKQEDTARATVIRHRAMVISQGTIIDAVLETPIDSTAPGPTRAIVSRDVYGFDGTRVLIPKGSRLYGEYQSETHVSQARAVVSWTSLVTPQGVSVRLSSPAADSRGEPGVPGRVDNHGFARLNAAVLQTALVVGGEIAARPQAGSVVIGAPAQGVTQGSALIPTPPGPTITVAQGADISVLVARDLDFSGSLPRE